MGLFGEFFVLFLRLNYMIISEAVAVFYNTVARSVKDFSTTCNDWIIHILLRHCRKILPFCVHLVGQVKLLQVPLKRLRNAPTCNSTDTILKAVTSPEQRYQITKVNDILTQCSCFLLKCKFKLLLYQFLNSFDWYLQSPDCTDCASLVNLNRCSKSRGVTVSL